jgi:transcriptional regulatory protein LevR/transcriptional regulator with AAA-type ATPase domain
MAEIWGESMRKIDEILQALTTLEGAEKKGISAWEISRMLNLDRANVSRYLNQLCSQGHAGKVGGRPVLYRTVKKKARVVDSLDSIVGARLSLQVPVQQAKAAILYPPRGLHTLILGETGVGKSMFAEMMYQFAKESQMIGAEAPFVRFNCADYADNPQLVMAQIFGVKKGAYSGADSDRDGLLKKADKGIFFLDEIHRLSPQGQEMLFTFIDKGFFRPMGETEKTLRVTVQIIAATTEEPHSFLLKAFTRRIPMTITLPSLRERTIKERYFLLEEFVKAEAGRLGKDIYIHKNGIIAFLLYDCPNNIGQFKSDLQLSCAKAFLNFKAQSRDYLLIEMADLHQRVKQGIFKLKNNREDVDRLLRNKGDILVFCHDEKRRSNAVEDEDETKETQHFYDVIEKRLEELKKQGMDEKEISGIISADIEKYFQRYLHHLPEKVHKRELGKVVGEEIAQMVEKILKFAELRLSRVFDDTTYCGLALHLRESVERIRRGNRIYHPRLNVIRTQYADEFMAAMEIARMLDAALGIETPLDEIGYLSMFLAAKPHSVSNLRTPRVGILVVMHGNATAGSMSQVANSLIGEECVHALDMPLSIKAESMYEQVKDTVAKLDEGRGVLLLVDMGSLSNLGDMIWEETGIEVRTVDMVSTPLVIEAGRKSLDGRGLDSIYQACQEVSRFRVQAHTCKKADPGYLILTICFTGEGASERLKELITEHFREKSAVEVMPMSILDRKDFLGKVRELSEKYHILAMVGTVNVALENVPFIPAPDIFQGSGMLELEKLIDKEQGYLKIKKSLREHLHTISAESVVDDVHAAIFRMEKALKLFIAKDVKVGILLHICFLIEKLRSGGTEVTFKDLDQYRLQHPQAFLQVQIELARLSADYQINIGENEAAYVVRMMVENGSSV